VKHLLIIFSILLLSSPVIGLSEETCYVVVDSSEEFNPTLLSNISVSIISQFLREVEPIPPAGVSMDSCLYQISVSKEQDTTFVTFKGKNLNSYGDSKLSGTDGFQQSLLKSLYRSLRDKRKLICEDYGEFIEKCGSVDVKEGFVNEERPKEVNSSNKFDGTNCHFMLLRPEGGYPGNPVVDQIAKGKLKIIKNRIQLTGKWFMKGNSSPESLSEAQIFINEDGSLEGVMEVYHMYTPEGETPYEPILVDLEETEGKLIYGARKSSFKFPMEKMIGRFDFLACRKG